MQHAVRRIRIGLVADEERPRTLHDVHELGRAVVGVLRKLAVGGKFNHLKGHRVGAGGLLVDEASCTLTLPSLATWVRFSST